MITNNATYTKQGLLLIEFKYSQVAFVTMVVVVSAQSPAKYPAGVDPAKCPKYELIKSSFNGLN